MNENTIVLSLISHTNIGKTTLTRTLLRRDVGEVRDAPHVTDESTRYIMWESSQDQLQLWDTPGFGNVSALIKRVQRENGAIGWIMNEVVDRLINRPLYSSLEAARNVRSQADVVLYLINARENPEDAGYVEAELQLLDILNKPVLMIINQASPENEEADRLVELEQQWSQHFAHHPCLKGTMQLDAFTRTWHQELRLARMIRPLLPQNKQLVLERLSQRYIGAQKSLFDACSQLAAQTMLFALNQRIKRSEKGEEQVFARLLGPLQERLDAYLKLLAEQHGIKAQGQARLQADLKQVTGLLQVPVPESRTGLLTGALAGAGSGLMADVLAGGLTLGGGAILGFLGGYLGGFSTARVLNFLARSGNAAWKEDALLGLYKLLVSYYLLTALHGRGKGSLQAGEIAPYLAKTVDLHWDKISEEVHSFLSAPDEEGTEQAEWQAGFELCFRDAIGLLLRQIYPNMDAELEASGY